MSNVKIFTSNIEQEAINQINTLVNIPVFSEAKVRIMPDVHAGAGCVIGFTANLGDKVIPNIVGVDIGCLDKDSEYLTPFGWKKMNEYAENDSVLGFDPSTNEADFVKPLAYIIKPCEQFFHYKNEKGLDQMVSEEHKMLVYSGYKGRGYKYTDMRPNELNTKSLENGYYSFETVFNRKNGTLDMTDNQIRLAVMIAADGRIRSAQNGYTLELHFKKDRKVQRAQELLNIENIPFTMSIIQDGSTMIYATVEDIYNKDLAFLYQGNSAQLKVAAEESLKWDGHEGYRSFYSSTNKKNVDAIQYAFHASGIRAGISITKYEDKGWKDVYVVTPTQNSKVGYNKQPTLEPSVDGKKYCFTMPQGYFVARRNGKIFLTGNCGMLAVELGNLDIDLERLDRVIHQVVPAGMNVHKKATCHFPLQGLKCYSVIVGKDEYFQQSIGTLGAGNHFVELDTDALGNKYLVIHTGSRNLGCQVAKYYQELAVLERSGKNREKEEIANTIQELKAAGREKEISITIAAIKARYAKLEPELPKELCYLTGANRRAYLHDMEICQKYAEFNRRVIAQNILNAYFQDDVRLINENDRGDWYTCDVIQYEFNYFETVHNYIAFEDNIVRKGAIYAGLGKKVLIPLNMRDGCIVGIGKGNEDWNCSAPHGAGRVMSRAKARETVDMTEYQASMKGIYTTTVSESTIDEAPMVYKPAEEIIENIQETVDIVNRIYPIYNFKAEE